MGTPHHVTAPSAGHKTSSMRPSRVPWRRLSLADLDAEILRTQRAAVFEHLPLSVWRRLDNMRKRRAALSKQ